MIKTEHLSDSVTLYLGDCRDVLPTLARAHAIITDPPYGVGLVGKTNDFRDSRHFDGGASLVPSKLYDDDEATIRALIGEAIPLALAKAERGAIFTGNRLLQDYPKAASFGCVYVPNGAGRDKWGFGCFNPILYYGKDPYLAAGKGSRPNSFSDNQPILEKIDHPCPKPVQWMRWLVNRASFPGETIIDPFAGSGTTGVACVQTGRKFTGVEKVPEYFDIMRRRIMEALARPDLFIEAPARAERPAGLFDSTGRP